MGADGCGWVSWGTGGMGGTKTRQVGCIYGRSGQYLGPMAGEISPDIMFWECSRKMPQIGTDGCRPVRMGEDGCIRKGESINKAKRDANSRSGHVFECMLTAKNAACWQRWLLFAEGIKGRNRGEPRGALHESNS